MDTIASIFSPPLLAAMGVATLGVGAVLFIIARRDGNVAIDLRGPLSWADPVEVRLVVYLILGAMSGTFALVARLLFALTSTGSFAAFLLMTFVLLGFLCNLTFFYAAIGSLLQGALGTRGRPSFWFSRLLSPIDELIMDLGDIIARLLFVPAPPRDTRRPRPRYDEYGDWDPRYAPRQPRSAPPRYAERPREVPPEPMPPVDDLDAYPYAYEDEAPPVRPQRPRSGQPRDIPRERLDLAIQEFEASLNPTQQEKLRAMRELVSALKQYT